jgi:hypothetical protein
MSRTHPQRSNPASRPRRRTARTRNARYALGLVAALGILFVMALQAHQLDQLQRKRTRLSQELTYEADAYQRLVAQWYHATRRERVMPRAKAELGLEEPQGDEKEVVALRMEPEPDPPNGMLEQLRRGLDRYGEIRSAVAGEDAP